MMNRLLRLLAGSVLAMALGAARGEQGDTLHFDISRFEVSGNTLLAPALVDSVLAPFVGKNRDFGDIQRALEALEAAFHARGYSVVQVELPEQQLNRGVVLLRVAQSKVGQVTVTGNDHFDAANIRRSLPGLVEGATPNIAAVSRSLKLANENPAKKVNLKLHSGATDGEIDAALEVTDERVWKASLNLDNTGSAESGRTHAGVVLQNANLWGRDHVFSLQYTTTVEEPNRVSVYGLGYHWPLYDLGDSLDAFASYSNVDSGQVAAGIFSLAVSGRGAVAGLRYNHHYVRVGNFEPTLVFGIDHKAYKNSVEFQGQPLGNDVTVHPLGVTFLGNWNMDAGDANLSLTLLHNLAGGSNGGADDFQRARAGARADYNMLRLAGGLNRTFAGDWQGRAIVNAQYSPDALVPGEQFGAGGAGSVRGFAEREVADDSGLSGNLEWYTPSLCAAHAGWQCRLLLFYDSAYVLRNDALPGESRHTAIASAGLGLRWLIGADMNLQIDYGHVLNAGSTGHHDQNRLHVRLALSY
ncbi:hemolysin activation/secretion protein [Oxalobacteraceae bacterium GrIS 1.11]